jgi:hypothetical protein
MRSIAPRTTSTKAARHGAAAIRPLLVVLEFFGAVQRRMRLQQ